MSKLKYRTLDRGRRDKNLGAIRPRHHLGEHIKKKIGLITSVSKDGGSRGTKWKNKTKAELLRR